MKRKPGERKENGNQENRVALEMPSRRVRSVNKLTCILAIAIFVLGAGAVSVCLALPPDKVNCDQTDVYDKLKCKHDSAASQVEYMASTVFAGDTLLGNKLTLGQRGQVGSIKNKSVRTRNNSAKDDFKRLAKSQSKSNKKACYLIPYGPGDDDNGDGICDYEQGDKSAKCAAIETDSSGNLQACNPEKKNKGKGKDGLECDQICDLGDAVTSDEAAEMQAEAQPMDGALDALATDLYDLNVRLEDVNSNSANFAFSRSVSSANSCADVPEITPGLDMATGILRQVSVTARGLAGIAGAGCDQTAVALGFGGNGSVVCMVFETAASILEIAYITCDEILIAEMGAIQSATLSCLQQMKGDMDAGFAKLSGEHADIKTNDNNNTTKIMNQIEQVRSELVRLLNTPLGQRPVFPTK